MLATSFEALNTTKIDCKIKLLYLLISLKHNYKIYFKNIYIFSNKEIS